MDPLQAKYPSLSPYQFSRNSPLMFADADGREFILKIYVNEEGQNIVEINYKIYAAGEEAKKEIDAGIALWMTHDGEKVLLNDIEFTVKLNFAVQTECTYDAAAVGRNGEKFSNSYTGNLKEDGLAVIHNNKIPVIATQNGIKELGINPRAGESDGSNITYAINNFEHDLSGLTKREKNNYAELIGTLSVKPPTAGNDPLTLSHEIGHTLGLQHNETYNGGAPGNEGLWDKGGIMTAGPMCPPTSTDLFNVVKGALQKVGMSQSQIIIPRSAYEKLFPKINFDTDDWPSSKQIDVKPAPTPVL
jgi:hypothetical protein